MREHSFFLGGNFVTRDVGAAVAHLRCRRKKRGWIRRNKLPVDVEGADVNHSQLN